MSSCPVSTLHIRTLQSSPLKSPLQEATSEPSAEKLTPLTCELYFGFKLVTTLTTLCNGRLRLCRFLEVSGNTFVILVYVSPPVSGGKRERHAVLNNAKFATFRKKAVTCGPRASSSTRLLMGSRSSPCCRSCRSREACRQNARRRRRPGSCHFLKCQGTHMLWSSTPLPP